IGLLQRGREQCLQRHSYAIVEFPTPDREQTAVRRLLREGVLEEVGGLRWQTAGVEQLGISEGRKMDRKLPLWESRYLSEQLPAKFSAYDRPHLEHTFGPFGQPVDAGHDYFFHGIRHWNARDLRAESPVALLLLDGASFPQGLHQLLEEKRYAFGF